MNTKQFLILVSSMLTPFLCGLTIAADMEAKAVRLVKLEIDAARLESYNAALKEEIEASVRVEPGVLGLYAVSEKDNPAHITILEMYADEAAYKAHLESPHYKKYKTATKDMVKSRTLLETTPIILSAKPK